MNKNILYRRIARQAVRDLRHIVQIGGKYGTYALWRATFTSIAFDHEANTVTFRFQLERSGTSPAGLQEMSEKVCHAMPDDIGPYHRATRGHADNSPPAMTMSIRYSKREKRQADNTRSPGTQKPTNPTSSKHTKGKPKVGTNTKRIP